MDSKTLQAILAIIDEERKKKAEEASNVAGTEAQHDLQQHLEGMNHVRNLIATFVDQKIPSIASLLYEERRAAEKVYQEGLRSGRPLSDQEMITLNGQIIGLTRAQDIATKQTREV